MFNFTGVLLSVVNGAVIDKPTSDFSGNAATTQITTDGERLYFIFLLISVFIAGMLTHYAYVEIKKMLKQNKEEKEEEEEEEEDKNKRE